MKVNELPPIPDGRICTNCSGKVVFSHRSYMGRGSEMSVFRCVSCGSAYGSAGAHNRNSDATKNMGRSKKRKPLPNTGPPDNPVIDAATAALLKPPGS